MEYGVAGIAKALICHGSAMTLVGQLSWRGNGKNSSLVCMKVRYGMLQSDRIFAKVEFVRYVSNIVHKPSYVKALSYIWQYMVELKLYSITWSPCKYEGRATIVTMII